MKRLASISGLMNTHYLLDSHYTLATFTVAIG